ncbi:unnamed protein product [Adineta ricciae]|uniref:F-box domain-containing protein n=1 Tax=Adineta ricciae TaxID=249248 RepID=A0A813QTV7_ADIRI|nr:unnamed protein product [Adineta ricciae]CAF0991640.1 unnamed protein product [Adineta ricciae]
MTSFESLPNEIFVEVFEYLNGFEIFLAFDWLNIRFYHLIRTIPICLNFQHVQKNIFDRFCTIIQSNPSIKHHIHSLTLSNKITCGQIDLFFSRFALNEFPHLRSLTIVQVEQQNIDKIQPFLPSISSLQTFRMIELVNEPNEIISNLPLTNLRRLAVPSIKSIKTKSTITHLTLSGCTLDYQLFEYIPLLRYLHVESIYRAPTLLETKNHSIVYPAVCLKHLSIDNYECLFDEFEVFAKLMPNLQRLAISALDNLCMIDAQRWQRVIQSLLPCLQHFQFIFGLYCKGEVRKHVIEKFQQFQNHIWYKNHQWNIEYVLDTNAAVIYTIPYISNTYRLTRSTVKYSSNDFNEFDNVTDLTLSCEATVNNCSYFFSNIRSLTLESLIVNSDQHILDFTHMKSLQTTVSLYHLTHLDISFYSSVEPTVLLEIFTKAPHLSSLTIDLYVLWTFFDDESLCYYFRRMIRRLNISKITHHSFRICHDVERFCRIFPNLQRLTCTINHSDQLSLLLNRLKYLFSLKIVVIPLESLNWFKDEAIKFNVMYRITHIEVITDGPMEMFSTDLYIWTGRTDDDTNERIAHHSSMNHI